MGVYERKSKQTKDKIVQSVLHLLKSNPLNKISINEIVNLAHINRSTFYRHFYDKQAVIELMENRIITSLKEGNDDFTNTSKSDSLTSEDNNIRIILGIIKKHWISLKILMKNGSDTNVDTFLENEINKIISNSIQNLNPKANKTEVELVCSYHSSGIMGVIKIWL